jgi:hypothetical protein
MGAKPFKLSLRILKSQCLVQGIFGTNIHRYNAMGFRPSGVTSNMPLQNDFDLI